MSDAPVAESNPASTTDSNIKPVATEPTDIKKSDVASSAPVVNSPAVSAWSTDNKPSFADIVAISAANDTTVVDDQPIDDSHNEILNPPKPHEAYDAASEQFDNIQQAKVDNLHDQLYDHDLDDLVEASTVNKTQQNKKLDDTTTEL